MAGKGNSCSIFRYFIKILKLFLIIPVTLILFINFLLMGVLSIPIYLYRYFLTKCAKCFRPDLANILASGNAIMVSYDQVYGRNDNTTVIALKVAGNLLDISLMRQVVTEKLINAKSSDDTLKYPELKQYPFQWMGYYFWKPEANFDINSHVDFYEVPEEGKFYNDVDVANVEAELVTRTHIKQTSPWQIIIFSNVKSTPEDSPKSVVYFRTHHGLMDGFALFQLIVGGLGEVDLAQLGMAPPVYNWKNKVVNILSNFILIFRTPFDLARLIIVPSIASITNDFRKEFSGLSREQIGTKVLQVPVDYLKEIRKVHNVAFGSVVTAAWLGGLRRTMLDLNMKIPRGMQFAYPLPMLGHPGKLRVHATAATIMLPIGIKDPVERLKTIDRYLKQVKGSAAASAVFNMRKIIGSMLPFMIDMLIPRQPPTGAMNIFAGTEEHFSVFGEQVNSVHFSYGQQKFRNSILFSSLTFCGVVYIKTAVNKNIFSENSDVDKIDQFVLEELDCLGKHSTV